VDFPLKSTSGVSRSSKNDLNEKQKGSGNSFKILCLIGLGHELFCII